MTYNVFGGTLSLTQSINHFICNPSHTNFCQVSATKMQSTATELPFPSPPSSSIDN